MTITKLLIAIVPIAACLALIAETARARPWAQWEPMIFIVPLLELACFAVIEFRKARFTSAALQMAVIPIILLPITDARKISSKVILVFLTVVIYCLVWGVVRGRAWYAKGPAWVILILDAIGFGFLTLVLLMIPILLGLGCVWLRFGFSPSNVWGLLGFCGHQFVI